jgi:hypothetical protein
MTAGDDRLDRDEVVVPGDRVSGSISMMRTFGDTAQKCAFIIVARWP